MGKKKGKAQNGRAKQKQKAKGNSPRTPMSGQQRYARQMLLGDDWEEENPLHFRGFAQGTPTGTTPRSANTKLRQLAPIAFVSAGTVAPSVKPPQNQDTDTGEEVDIALDDSEEDDDLDDEDIDDSAIHTNIVIDADIELSEQGVARMNIETTADTMEVDTEAGPSNTVAEDSPEPLPFVVDTVGDSSLASRWKSSGLQSSRRDPSPARSDSSEEVVLFHGRGRGKPTVVDDPVARAPSQKQNVQKQPAQAPIKQAPHVTDDLLNALKQPVAKQPTPPPSRAFANTSASAPAVGWGAGRSKHDTTATSGENWSPAPDVPYWKKGKGRAVPRPDLAPSAAEKRALENSAPRESKVQFAEPARDEEVTEAGESVATLRANWQKVLREKNNSTAAKASRRNKRGRKKGNRAMKDLLLSDDDEDDEEGEAAYDDYMQNLMAQLEAEGEDGDNDAVMAMLKSSTHSKSIAGPSMVVDGEEYGDDEVLSKNQRELNANLELNTDSDEWESDDSEMNPDLDELSVEEDLNASDLESDLEHSERQQWEDEDDLRQRRLERMTDEQIARLLAKQEELGMEADELLLEDGAYGSLSDEGFGDIAAARAGLSDITNSSFARTPKKHSMRRSGGDRQTNYPDASALADTVDQYGENGFDIMDFDRPSLRPTKKGRKGRLPPELEAVSDDELRDALHNQWDKDRAKKRQAKLEREELRAEGMLGSAGRKGRADLKAKYPMGMTMKQVHDELRDFMQNEDLSDRAFPPMDKFNRKSLHEICVALNLKSKSQGAGSNRFPIIYKTSRTPEYSNDMFGRVLNASTRGFLTNSKAKKLSKQVGKPKAGRGGGFSKAATGLREGEVVGAGAAEIGANNFGHRMMEKMGWTKGAGLGKDGEGRLMHVEQVMRTSKAGLG